MELIIKSILMFKVVLVTWGLMNFTSMKECGFPHMTVIMMTDGRTVHKSIVGKVIKLLQEVDKWDKAPFNSLYMGPQSLKNLSLHALFKIFDPLRVGG